VLRAIAETAERAERRRRREVATVSHYADSINRHYGAIDVSARILKRLEQAGRDAESLTRDDLTPFDEFHGGGRHSTRALAEFAGLRAGMEIVDVGSGIGGPARTLAAEFGCRVVGLDLTVEFCRAATLLTERLGMTDVVRFQHGNALDMPFDNESFDVAWSQNTIMNIEDKGRFFSEVQRVLRPGGLFAFEALLARERPDLQFPVFWAASADLSFLARPEDVRASLASAGLAEVAWEETTEQVKETSRKRIAALEKDGPAPLGLGVIVALDLTTKMRNSLTNIEEGRTVAIQAVYVRTL